MPSQSKSSLGRLIRFGEEIGVSKGEIRLVLITEDRWLNPLRNCQRVPEPQRTHPPDPSLCARPNTCHRVLSKRKPLQHWFSNFSLHQDHLRTGQKRRLGNNPTPRISVSGGLCWDPRMRMCIEFQAVGRLLVPESHCFSQVPSLNSKTSCILRVAFYSWLSVMSSGLQ